MNNTETILGGARAIIQELLKVASEAGRDEELRLGRKMTEAEAVRLAEMVERQFKTALAMSKF